MKIMTVITDPNHAGYREMLVRSCEFHGHELVALVAPGMQMNPLQSLLARLGFRGDWAFRRKDFFLERCLQTLPDEEIILFTDGYDAFMLAGEEEILAKFEGMKADLVVSAERNCSPDPELAADYPEAPTAARYLNSGGLMGRAGHLREVLGKVRAVPSAYRFRWSNQYRWTRVFLEEPHLFHLDYHSEIFFCASVPRSERGTQTWSPNYWREHLIHGDRIRLPNGGTPCHLHLNGPLSSHLLETEDLLRPIMPWQRSS